MGAIPMGAVQPGSGLVNGLGTGFVPRRIDIQIRRGTVLNYEWPIYNPRVVSSELYPL